MSLKYILGVLIARVRALEEYGCKRKIICGVCKKLVLGLYFWCSDCGHGGHNKCMDEWFSKEKNCSFGCKHKCIK